MNYVSNFEVQTYGEKSASIFLMPVQCLTFFALQFMTVALPSDEPGMRVIFIARSCRVFVKYILLFISYVCVTRWRPVSCESCHGRRCGRQ